MAEVARKEQEQRQGEVVAFPASESFSLAYRRAEAFSKATLVPRDYQGKPENVLIAMELADRLNMSVLEVMNRVYIVHGRPSMSATLAISLANSRGPFADQIRFDTQKTESDVVCTAKAVLKRSGEEVSSSFSWSKAQRAGYTANKIYTTHAEQMLCYRAALQLIRLYCPEVLMGLTTDEEARHIHPEKGEKVEGLKAMLEVQNDG